MWRKGLILLKIIEIQKFWWVHKYIIQNLYVYDTDPKTELVYLVKNIVYWKIDGWCAILFKNAQKAPNYVLCYIINFMIIIWTSSYFVH